MKELSIEEKAKAYDEAIEKARRLCAYPTTKPFISDLQDIFPELKESEDEKVRKAILELVRQSSEILEKKNQEQMLAWLEKQSEHDSIEEPNFFDDFRNSDVEVDSNEDGLIADTIRCKIEKQGEQKSAEWSEEDIKTLERIVCILDGIRYYNTVDSKQEKSYQSEIDWLKSLKYRVQPQQEWSKEESDMTDKITLREFINELEKLSDGGKNDNLEVGIQNSDEEFCPIGWCGVDEYYPIEEIEENNPQHPTKCIMIQY